jgi:hypothetical protein
VVYVQQRSGPGCLTLIGGTVVTIVLLVLVVAVVGAIGRASNDINQLLGTPTMVAPTAGVRGAQSTSDGYSCKLVAVRTFPGDGFADPKPGNVFVLVHLQLANNSGQDQTYNQFDFKVQSSTGNVTGPEFVYPAGATNDTLGSGTLKPSGSVSGDIVFQLPKGDHGAQHLWEPGFSGTDYTWSLGL